MAGGLTGSLEQWPLPELLNMLGSSRQSGRLEVSAGGAAGNVYLQDGAIVHAAAASESGVAALATLFALQDGAFSFEPRVPSPAVTLSRPLDTLLAEVAREVAEREMIRRVVPSAAMHPRLTPEPPAGPITLQPTEWRLIAAADGSVSLAEIAARLRVDPGPVIRAYFGLRQRGLVRFEAPPANVTPIRPPLAAVEPATPATPAAPEPAPEAEAATTESAADAVAAPMGPPAPVAAQVAVPTSESTGPSAPAQPVPVASAAFFRELSRAAAESLGPLAAVIVEDTVEAFGATVEAFPRARCGQLIEAIAREITDDRRRAEFQSQMLRLLRELQKAA